MTLAGGDPESLSLAQFMDAGYALLVESYQSIPGGHLMDAIDQTAEYRAGGETAEEIRERSVESENERSLAQLNSMMRGAR